LTGQVTEEREHPPDLTLLSNGWILLNFGHRHPLFGVQGIISKDGGHTWEPQRLIFEDRFFGSDIGYPSTARLSDGRLITLFYSAGSAETPHAPYEMIDVFCRAVCYDEEEVIKALV
ncbi:MAG: exo-alpha-sialidase, partial [Candidatus Latescibacteria bacterium]|nr:exo-alpha-sialidase [Candidatus Latescibacterota bacterium]